MPIALPSTTAIEMYHRALALRDEGDMERAARLLEQSAALFLRAGRPEDEARARAAADELRGRADAWSAPATGGDRPNPASPPL